jgi:hypothetical protein
MKNHFLDTLKSCPFELLTGDTNVYRDRGLLFPMQTKNDVIQEECWLGQNDIT